MVTDYEYLLICRMVTELQGTGWSTGKWNSKELYNFKEETKQTLDELLKMGWKLFTTSERKKTDIDEQYGYMGVCFINHKTKKIVIAHRGTQLEEGNIIADIAILKTIAPRMLTESALPFIEKIHNYNTRFKYTIIQTGFSLGGFLAEAGATCSVHLWNKLPYRHNEAVCYESPGAHNALVDLAKNNPKFSDIRENHKHIIIYVTEPNLVNTANPHHGEVRQIQSWVGNFKFIPTPNDEQLKTGVALRLDTFEMANMLIHAMATHDQDQLRKQVNVKEPNLTYQLVKKWPVAINDLIMEDESIGYVPNSSFCNNPNDITRTILSFIGVMMSNAFKGFRSNVANWLFLLTYDSISKQGAVGVTHKLDRKAIVYFNSIEFIPQYSLLNLEQKLLTQSTKPISTSASPFLPLNSIKKLEPMSTPYLHKIPATTTKVKKKPFSGLPPLPLYNCIQKSDLTSKSPYLHKIPATTKMEKKSNNTNSVPIPGLPLLHHHKSTQKSYSVPNKSPYLQMIPATAATKMEEKPKTAVI